MTENNKKINDIIGKINNKENLKLSENEHYFIYNVLFIFLEDYFETERLSEKTEEEILVYANTEISRAKEILNLLLERGILLKSNRKTLNNDLIDIYCLSYAYIKNIENMITYALPDTPKVDKTENNEVVKTNYIENYQKYSELALNSIADALKECFNFHVEIDNGMIDFEMGGCTYNVYLSRGYIVLEEADNSTIDNVWTVNDINEFVDLIKDLREDN